MIKKLWLKFETITNKVIALILRILLLIYQKTVPDEIQKKIVDTYVSCRTKTKTVAGEIKKKTLSNIQFKIKFKAKTKTAPKIKEKFTFKDLLVPLKKTQTVIVKIIQYLKSLDLSSITPKQLIGKLFYKIKLVILPPIEYIKKKVTSLEPNMVVTIIITLTLLSIIGLGIYKSGRKIYVGVVGSQMESDDGEGEPFPKYRESYFKRILPAKQVIIHEVTMPIYIDSINSVRTLMIDMTLITSNRYTREFLDKNTGLVKDRLNNTMHPIIPDFPLTLEGKTIIREKVIHEVNALLKELKIEGEIKEVYFQMIIAA